MVAEIERGFGRCQNDRWQSSRFADSGKEGFQHVFDRNDSSRVSVPVHDDADQRSARVYNRATAHVVFHAHSPARIRRDTRPLQISGFIELIVRSKVTTMFLVSQI